MPKRSRTVAEQYIADAIAGRVVVSKWVRLQCERHVRDLREGKARGLKFDRAAAQDVLEFVELFGCGVDGDWYGVPIKLDPGWHALLWILYGWKRKSRLGTWIRRFKIAYSEMGAGSLKSLILSVICLYELYAFGEMGAQVYSAATDKNTAKRIFDSAVIMAKESEHMSRDLEIGKQAIAHLATSSTFQPVASEDTNLQGLRPSFVCIDELHAHRSAGVWDAFYSRLGKRLQPLMFAITNSGYDRNSVCFRQREYSEKVLEGVVPDDTWFAWICGIDEGDDYADEKVWPKATPCFGSAVQLSEMREQFVKASADPSSLNAFLRFRLCVWTTAHSTWMPLDKWDACAGPVLDREQLRGRRCYGGLDLSTTTDISALVLVFEPDGDDPYWRVLPHFWLPKDNIQWRVKKDRVPYDVWERQGAFELTAGPVIDYRAIRAKVNELRDEFEIVQIGFDRWNSTDLVTNLIDDGFEMVKVGQGFGSFNAPTKRLLELVLAGQLAHGMNPILRWMVSNVIVLTDPAGNVKPDKSKSREKIDGIVALIMALTGVMGASDCSPGLVVA